MSKKRSNPVEDPPTASSSDEDELETPIGEGEDSSSEEEGGDDDVASKTPSAVATEKQVSDSDSESGSESDGETDSESEPEKKDEVVTKPVTQSKDSDSVSKNQDSKKVKNSEKSVAKRSRETDEEVSTDVKKRVKKVSGEEEKKSATKTYFQRVWSEDDEISLLQGLIDYKNDTGVSPFDDTNGVYQLLKKVVSFDVNKNQFMKKLASLKKKYENNLGKAKNGDEPTFVKPHDRKAFALSKFVWGANGMALESAVKSIGKSKRSTRSKKVDSVKIELDSSLTNKGQVSMLGAAEVDTFAKSSSLVNMLTRFGVDELDALQGLSRLASEDKKRFEEQWKALKVREFVFHSQKSGFLHELVTKMAEALGSNS